MPIDFISFTSAECGQINNKTALQTSKAWMSMACCKDGTTTHAQTYRNRHCILYGRVILITSVTSPLYVSLCVCVTSSVPDDVGRRRVVVVYFERVVGWTERSSAVTLTCARVLVLGAARLLEHLVDIHLVDADPRVVWLQHVLVLLLDNGVYARTDDVIGIECPFYRHTRKWSRLMLCNIFY